MLDRSRDKASKAQIANALFGRIGVGVSSDRFRKNQTIFVQGEAADTVCYLHEGRVKATVLSDVGNEAVVGVFNTGQFFGEACFGHATLRTATFTALEECLITSIKKEAMLSTLDSESDFAKFFITHLLSRNARLEEDLMDQLLHSSERRLARLLLVLANYEASPGQDEHKPVAVALSQKVLAEMIGTTRSRVSTFMNKFREKGFISYDSRNGRIEVHVAPLLSLLGS